MRATTKAVAKRKAMRLHKNLPRETMMSKSAKADMIDDMRERKMFASSLYRKHREQIKTLRIEVRKLRTKNEVLRETVDFLLDK